MPAPETPLPPSLEVQVGTLRLRSPLIAASGTSGFGRELAALGVLPSLGALVTKTITPEPRQGNPPPRTWETRAGLLNSIGLANPGLKSFLEDIVPSLKELPCPCVANIGGFGAAQYAASAEALTPLDCLVALELNLSCPNVHGGLDLSRSPQALGEVTRAVRGCWPKPLWVKLTPSVVSVAPLVEEAARCGADAVVVGNTYPAMALNWRSRRSRLGRPTGGLSGPCIKPLTVRLVWEAWSAGALPVIASGGVAEPQDVLELFVAGASAVQLGSLLLRDPCAPVHFVAALADLLAQEGIERIGDLTGTADL